MPDANESKQQGICPKCSTNLRYQGAANDVEPFWTRIGAFFAYPFAVDPMVLIAVCTFVPIFLGQNLFGLLGAFLLFCILTKYVYSIVEHTSEGHMTPPTFASAFTGDGMGIIFQQIGVFILMGLIIVGAGHLGGPVLAVIVSGFLLLSFPASVIILALEKNIADAVNPLRQLALMGAIGWPYMVLYAHLVLLFFALSAVQDFVNQHFPLIIANPISGFLFSYFMVIIFHLLGYILFQYQDKLGYAADVQDDEPAPASIAPNRSLRVDADIDINLKEGRYDAVLGILEEQLKKNPNNIIRREQLFKLLWASHNLEKLSRYAQPILRLFVSNNTPDKSALLLKSLLKHNPDFQLQDPELIFQLTQQLYHQGEYRLILVIVKDMHKRFDDFDRLPDTYLVVVKTLANGLQQWDKAAKYLMFVKQKFADHPSQSKLPDYLADVAAHRRLEFG
ncbi:hypothetical protein [Alkalimarinus sediminis]|uniref:Uncharacterized protein n=1 Tax=Alkalimarinus sediminis TaxID=1632866 RepID=A0A9E8HGZ7_9ALTE|nr:hypothetical protein [Alkalimarinus sediminis]UZW74490.1 hypothetical protein NNL22_15920 [Alkalimarinus sediminis]